MSYRQRQHFNGGVPTATVAARWLFVEHMINPLQNGDLLGVLFVTVHAGARLGNERNWASTKTCR